MTYRDFRYQIHLLFEVDAGGRVGYYIDTAIMALIALNVVAVILETVEPLYTDYSYGFYGFEVVSVAIFSVEYLARVWCAVEHPAYDHPLWGRLRYAASPYMVIDLLAIVPFFIGALIDLRFLRALRFLRFLRIFKLARYSATLKVFATVIRDKREDLVLTSFAGLILLLVASGLMYFVERAAQPEAFSSIPAAMSWGVVTLTTVGYGDVHPVTPLGKVVGAVVAVFGVALFALPASILASGFIEEAGSASRECPHCGEEIEDEL